MNCLHPARAIFGPKTAPALMEGYPFTKCTTCFEERDMNGQITLPANAYTERAVPWSKARLMLGYGSATFTDAVRNLNLSTDQTQARSTAA